MTYSSLFIKYVMSDYSEFQKSYEARFNSESTVHFPLKINNYDAFFFLHPDIVKLLEEIYKYDKKVRDAFSKLPPVAQKQYIKKSLIDEIEFTNQIEGVLSTRKDINDIIEDINNNQKEKSRLKGIINKYQLLINEHDYIFASSKDVRKIYDEMLSNEIFFDDPKNLPDGEIFRSHPVHIYKSGEKIIHDGIYPEANIIEYMDKSLSILNDEKLPSLIRISIFHYLFGYIHPFYDGNGRINRFISSYYLTKEFTPLIGYRLSMNIKENLVQYLDAFEHTNDVRNRGDISTFVYEFLDIILKAYQKTELYAINKFKEIEECRAKIDIINELNINDKNTMYYLCLVEIFRDFGFSIEQLIELTECSRSQVYKSIEKLNVLHLITKKNMGRRTFYSALISNLKELDE